ADVAVGARRAVRDDRVLADAHVADVVGARVRVVAIGGDAARLAAGDRRVDAAAQRIAGIGRARVPVIAVERRPYRAEAALAGLVAVAYRVVGARRPVRDCDVVAAEQRVARIRRARILVVAVERCPGRAGAGLAGLRAVADVGVETRRAVRQRGVRAAGDRVAGVRRARVAVVAVERRPGHADAAQAGLGAVADVRVRARRAVERGRVLAARLRIAGVGRADVAVVAVERRPGAADAVLAGLRTVAHRGVGTRRAVHDRGVLAAENRIAAVRGARVRIDAVERRARGADAVLARLRAVAHRGVGTGQTVRDVHVPAARDRVTGVGRAG